MSGVRNSSGGVKSQREDALRAGKKRGVGVNVFSKKTGRQTCLRECREGTQRKSTSDGICWNRNRQAGQGHSH